MRILHVAEAAGGGVLSVLRSLAEGANEAGHDVLVACGRRPQTPDRIADAMPPGVETVELPWAKRTPHAQLSAALALRRIARTWEPDVVHLHSSFAGAVGVLAIRDRPLIYTPHGYAFAREPTGGGKLAAFRAIERLVASRCSVVAAVSESEALLAREYAGAKRVRVVLNGAPELDGGVRSMNGHRRRLVVGVGRICEARRPAASARILSALSGDAEVLWIGAAPEREDAPLREAGIPITGWLEHADAVDGIAKATVLLHWSEWDGAPLAVLEAMARDVVVIASDIPANRELLGPDQVRPDEDGALELIRRVLGDDRLREELLANQRDRGTLRGAGRMAAEYVSIYEDVLHERCPATSTGAIAARTI